MSMNDTGGATIRGVLADLRRRQRMLNTVCWGVHGLLWGAVAAAAAAGVLWATGPEGAARLMWAALGLVPLFGAAGAAAGAMLPISDLQLARAMDRAASGEDRFASALQLAAHPRQGRVQLIAEDALARVRHIPAQAALPLRVPRAVRWIPAPVLAIAALMLMGPMVRTQASPTNVPEISAEEWASLHDEFRRDLQQLPEPRTAEEEELRRKLEELAELLKEKPEKREALAEIARLSERVQEQRRSLGMREQSMRNAARAMASSEALKRLASMLKQGEYTSAAGELRKLSSELKAGQLNPDASEFEAISADLQRLAAELGEMEEMQEACQNGSKAASSMNREALAEALRRLAEQMEKDAERMRQCDNLGRSSSLLEQLKRRMNQRGQCQGCKEGCSSCNGGGLCQHPGAGKGGKNAGWGSAAKWDGGQLAKTEEKRLPELVNPLERQGASTSFQVVSPGERAQSGLKYEELYAEFVQKAEADLDLESVPVAYRDYLRRYFNAIRPQESVPEETGP